MPTDVPELIPLTSEDLNAVSGGLNPQPEPPGRAYLVAQHMPILSLPLRRLEGQPIPW